MPLAAPISTAIIITPIITSIISIVSKTPITTSALNKKPFI
jgi:hypothetical protein